MAADDTTTPMSIHERIMQARMIASEIAEHDERLISLAIALRDQLEPEEGEDPDNPIAWRLVEVLVRLGEDARGHHNLDGCLQELSEAARHV